MFQSIGMQIDEKDSTAAEEEEEEDDDGVESQQLGQQQIYNLHSINSTIVIRHYPSQGISFQLWPAATTLLNFLDRHRSNPTILSSCSGGRRLRLLELGSGTGVVGIAAAALLGATVTLTDLPHVLPNLQFNVAANAGILELHGGTVDVAALQWGDTKDMEATGREYDVILGSDMWCTMITSTNHCSRP